MSSRIEQIIEEIEEYIDRDCKYQPLSTTKIIVNKEHLDELLRELRMKTPDEIKRYQKIIAEQRCHPCRRAGKSERNDRGSSGPDHRACERARDHAAGVCSGK